MGWRATTTKDEDGIPRVARIDRGALLGHRVNGCLRGVEGVISRGLARFYERGDGSAGSVGGQNWWERQ